jgi:hypothetical protein
MTAKPAVLLLGLSFLLACARSDPVSPELDLAALAGTWALTSWQYTSVANPTDHVDWVSSFNLTGSLGVTSGGAFTVAPALPGGFGSDFGILTMDADSIYWDGENDEQWVGATLKGSVLTLDWREVEFAALHRDGVPQDVRLVVTFHRQ